MKSPSGTSAFPSPAEAIAGRFRPDAGMPPPDHTARGAAEPAPDGMPALTTPALRLQVLSGPQAGASERLLGTHSLIGNGLDCDVVVHLPGPSHRALLSVQSGAAGWQARITPLEGRFRLYGRELTLGRSHDWPSGQDLLMADLRLGWSEDEALPGQARAPATVPAQAVGPAPSQPSPAPPRAAARRILLAIGLLLLALLALGLALPLILPLEQAEPAGATPSASQAAASRRPDGGERPAAAAPASAPDALQRWLSRQGEHALKLSGQDPSTKLSGYLADEAQLRRLKKDLLQQGLSPQLDVQVRSRQRQGAEQLIAGFQLRPRLHWPGDGQLDIHLAWQELPRARPLALSLLEEVPGLQSVRIYGPQSGKPQITGERLSQGLRINEEWVLPLEAVFQGRNQLLMTQIEPRRMLVLSSGRHVFEGGRLDPQRTVEQISLDSVLILEDGLRKRVLLP